MARSAPSTDPMPPSHSINSPLAYEGPSYKVQPMKTRASSVSTGRRGGKVSSPAKSMAARQNILLRWHGRNRKGVIPEKALIDGAWYQGRGRTAPIALWDAGSGFFHAVGWSTVPDPENYPAIEKRVFRLKQERHADAPGGTFEPLAILPIPHESERGD